MGAMCEEAINCAIQGLLKNDEALQRKTFALEKEISAKEREIEQFCFRLMLREQPVASDFRFITASQKIANSMYRIGDQTADVALLFEEISVEQRAFAYEYIGKMVAICSKMLLEAVDSFVHNDIKKAAEVKLLDDKVDNYFSDIKKELVGQISKDPENGETWLDILMIAKHLERIGDHAKNIARSVIYSVQERD
jgi:phosphate transport system protein